MFGVERARGLDKQLEIVLVEVYVDVGIEYRAIKKDRRRRHSV